MLTALTVFELQLIYQYLLGRVFGMEQVPGILADRLPSSAAFFTFLAGVEGLLAVDKKHEKGAPLFPRAFNITTWHCRMLSMRCVVPITQYFLAYFPHSTSAGILFLIRTFVSSTHLETLRSQAELVRVWAPSQAAGMTPALVGWTCTLGKLPAGSQSQTSLWEVRKRMLEKL